MFSDKPANVNRETFSFRLLKLGNWSVIMIPPPLRSARKRAATVWEIGERKDTRDGMERGEERGVKP